MSCGGGVVRVALVGALALAGAGGSAAAARADDPIGTDTAPAATTPAPAPCVAAGLVAVLAPQQPPQTAGLSISAAAPTGTTADTVAAPADGSLLRTGAAEVGAGGCVAGSRDPGGTAVSAAALSLFGGAVAADSLEADLVPAGAGDSGWHLRAAVAGLRVGGRPVALRRGLALPVGGWAVLRTPARHELDGDLRWWAAAFELDVTAAHAGLPAGTVVLVGYANADTASAPLPPPARAVRRVEHPRAVAAPSRRHVTHRLHHKRKHRRAKRQSRPLKVTPPLKAGPYVFPVYGVAAAGDSYGGPRSDVSGGWHHGDDIFAPLGTPILAVSDGTVYSVGWNRVGGWRLWLRDTRGNTYYYAHLSAYTILARNREKVKAGQMLAFLGHTGDAFPTPPHLHFEIHPVSLHRLGYDGAVDPTAYLNGWRHRRVLPTLRPLPLPADASRLGEGALVNYRQLLASREPHRLLARSSAPEPAPAPAAAVASAPARAVRAGAGGTSPAALAGIAVFALLAVASLVLLRWPAARRVVRR